MTSRCQTVYNSLSPPSFRHFFSVASLLKCHKKLKKATLRHRPVPSFLEYSVSHYPMYKDCIFDRLAIHVTHTRILNMLLIASYCLHFTLPYTLLGSRLTPT